MKYRDENIITVKAVNAHNKEDFESIIKNLIKTGWEKYAMGVSALKATNPTEHPNICWWAVMIKRERYYNLTE